MPKDFGDEAQELTEQHLNHSLQKRKTLTVPFSGFCLNCGESVGQRRYCDATCRQEHEETMKRKSMGLA